VARPSRVYTILAMALTALTMGGCGSVGYTAAILNATQAVEEARQAGASGSSPYEYYYAVAHLEKAREQAGRAEYQYAIQQAETAQQYGIRARDQARRRIHEGNQ
jgi:hypothetical protein